METMLKKIKFDPEKRNAVIHAPHEFPAFPARPDGDASIVAHLEGKFDWIMLFVKSAAELKSLAPKAMTALNPNGLVWFCFPKKSSKIKTDLDRDHGWEVLSGMEIKYVNLVSIDGTWSGFGATHGSEQQSKRQRKTSEARTDLLAQYMDHATREMRYPPELETLLAAHPTEKAVFLSLSFTNRKEYVEWIITAKRQETKEQRLAKIIPYLQEGRKNPAGR